jgi:hypothetical protein
MTVWVPDVGNGGDRLAALPRRPDDEVIAADIIASTQCARPARCRTRAVGAALGAGRAARSGGAAAVAGRPRRRSRRLAAALRRLPGHVRCAAELEVAAHDPTEGPNVSLNGKTFEVHVYLSPTASAWRAGRGHRRPESIVVDGPQGQLHRWHRARAVDRAGRSSWSRKPASARTST